MADFQPLIAQVARKYGLPVNLLSALVKQESGFNPRAVSPAGAQGLTQLMPATAQGLGVKDPFDPLQSLNGGAKYLRQQLDRFGSPKLALAAYNAGPGAVEKYGGIPPYAETQHYVDSILGAAGNLKSGRRQPLQTPAAGVLPTTPTIAPAAPSSRRAAALEFILGPDLASMMPVGGSESPSRALPPSPGPRTRTMRVRGRVPAGSQGLVELAKSFIGTPYSWGGGTTKGPSKGFGRGANTVGFDCSSFLQFLAAKQGVSIPRTTYEQVKVGQPVDKKHLRVGDAVFFGSPSDVHHVGMYIGNGKFIEAPRTGLTIRVSNLAGRSDFVTARRYF